MNWLYYKRALLPDTEVHNDVLISKKDAKLLLRSHKAWLLRCTTNFDQENYSSAYYVIKDSWGGIEELSSKTRNQVRKALKFCEVKKITKATLYAEGYTVYREAHLNYKSKSKHIMNPKEYDLMIQNLKDRDLFGCFDRETNKLIAYAQNIVGEGVSYSLVKANPRFFKSHHPYYALFFKMNEYYLFLLNKKYVNDGFRTVDNHSNIQNFLIDKFKFRKAYCRLQIEYVWWLKHAVHLLYHFRRFIPTSKIRSILNMEAMNRGEI